MREEEGFFGIGTRKEEGSRRLRREKNQEEKKVEMNSGEVDCKDHTRMKVSKLRTRMNSRTGQGGGG